MLLAVAVITAAVGLTGTGKRIDVLTQPDAGSRPRVLLVGGLDGSAESARQVRQQFQKLAGSKSVAYSAIPLANPENATLTFPPIGEAYGKQTESHYLWRYIGTQAPDLVVILGADSAHLREALENNAVAEIGSIPTASKVPTGAIATSPARAEMNRRLARTRQQVAAQLAVPYGHELKEAVYIPAIALIARLRMGALADVETIAAPYFSGVKNSMDNSTSSHLSGPLLFAALAERTGKPRYIELVRAAADMAFTADGRMKEAMPLHSEMSDSVFMGTPILVKAGKLTGEQRYYDMAIRHMRFMQKLCLRRDGIYRHSPLDETAWGRGNGFPAIGLALSLESLPKTDAGYPEMLAAFQKHIAALSKYQDETGMWREVIDLPGSYREFTATSMIAVSMIKGIRNGWLPAKQYQPMVDRAWKAINGRISTDGRLIDVCTSTGKQKSLQDYLDRTAILGLDPRGGAMALLLATE